LWFVKKLFLQNFDEIQQHSPHLLLYFYISFASVSIFMLFLFFFFLRVRLLCVFNLMTREYNDCFCSAAGVPMTPMGVAADGDSKR